MPTAEEAIGALAKQEAPNGADTKQDPPSSRPALHWTAIAYRILEQLGIDLETFDRLR